MRENPCAVEGLPSVRSESQLRIPANVSAEIAAS
jgi:hypothetical protein